MSAWHNKTFKNAAKKIGKLKKTLADLLNGRGEEIDWGKVREVREEIKKLWNQEEKFWGQRSRLKWLKWGDKNSKFFHATTVQRRERNKIQRLKLNDEVWKEGQEDVTQAILDHFNEVYMSNGVQGLEECTRSIPKLMTEEMNGELLKPVSVVEIKKGCLLSWSSKSTWK